MERRKLFLLLNCILAFVLISCIDNSSENSFSENLRSLDKPNVLFIICDDLNDWVLHPPNHPKAKVPNIDRLSRKGVVFANAHTTVPVCGPSRLCLMSGMYPQSIDNYGFNSWEGVSSLQDCVPLPLHFRNNGYNVFGTGKLFHEGAGGDFYTEYGIASDYGPWPWRGKGDPKYTPHPNHYEEWNDYLTYQMHRDLDYAPLSDVPEWKADKEGIMPGAKGWYNTKTAKPFRYIDENDRDKLPDEISTDFAIEILGRKHEKPFFLGVGLIRPHSPLYVPEKYFKMFPLEEITLPPYLKNDRDDCAPMLKDRWEWGFTKYDALIKAGGDEGWKEWVQAYLACMAFVDDQVGKLVESLNNSPYKENTIIVLTSDNGYHIGEKDCIQKWHLWNESTKVPLYVSLLNSKDEHLVCNNPVSLIDLYPTLADICKLPGNNNGNVGDKMLDGKSLLPLLNDPGGVNWENRPILTAIENNKTDEVHFSVIDKQYRYTLCLDGEEELYDHYKDPNEWVNLADKNEYVKVKRELHKEMNYIFEKTEIPKGFSSALDIYDEK
jgi:arylsulfatase A-like enzyme